MQSELYHTPQHEGVNVVFRDGKLRIWQNTFGHADQVFIVRPWPDVRAWVRREGGPWRGAFCGVWKLAGVFSLPEFDELVPLDIQAVLTQVPSQHFAMLSLLARVPGARELACHDLALTWLVANAKLFQPRCGLREVRRALRRGRRKLLQLLDFPAENRVLNLLRKLELSTFDHVGELWALQGLDMQQLGELSHLPRIDGDMLALLSAPELRRLLGPGLLRELALRPDPLRASNSDSATAQLWRVLQHSLLAGLEVQPVRTLAELERAHWSAWCGFSTMARTCERWLPAPPLPPPPPQLGARRLADESDLAEEGAKMQHCIANPTGKYVAQLRAGRAAVFHLSSPAPATVYLVHCGERWHFGEMNGVRNARPPVGQERLVRGWLASMDTAQPT